MKIRALFSPTCAGSRDDDPQAVLKIDEERRNRTRTGVEVVVLRTPERAIEGGVVEARIA